MSRLTPLPRCPGGEAPLPIATHSGRRAHHRAAFALACCGSSGACPAGILWGRRRRTGVVARVVPPRYPRAFAIAVGGARACTMKGVGCGHCASETGCVGETGKRRGRQETRGVERRPCDSPANITHDLHVPATLCDPRSRERTGVSWRRLFALSAHFPREESPPGYPPR